MIIKNGLLISPGTRETYQADLKITGSHITDICPAGTIIYGDADETVLDASGCVVAPGLIDVHVHFRDPGYTYKEDLHTGARAAAAGGFTTVVCMANTKPPVDNPDTLLDLLLRAKKESIRIRFTAAITKGLLGQELTDFESLAGMGACGFTDDGIPLTDQKLAADAMRLAKTLQLPLSFHEEDPDFIIKAGTNQTAPAVAEDLLVARDCMLSNYTGAVINIQHISSATSVELVRAAKKMDIPVFAEATPHHFSLTEKAVEAYGTYAKMNPPLRTESDRLAIIAGLKDGTIDIIATDHAPHRTAEKNREDFFSAPSGIIGLETSLALGITNLVRPGQLTLMQLLEKMTVNPAALYRINEQAQTGTVPEAVCKYAVWGHTDSEETQSSGSKLFPKGASPAGIVSKDMLSPGSERIFGVKEQLYGSIRPGCVADLVIFNPDETFIAGQYQSKSENSPFTGMELYGKIHYTICGGNIVWDGGLCSDL
ncbi:MAG: dihydroorotase [Clostridiales bacterium]|nr:dihydroorotase [Clostridiales bacterium]